MKRLAFKMYLNEGRKAEYKKRHDEIWPELKQLLKNAGISEYSIFLDEETNTLFAFQKTGGKCCSQDLGQTEIVKKWWAYMQDIMKTNADNSPVSIPLEEVFYLGFDNE
ncbi:L-rhamnose mutarotase [uncultured Draconibacterium sp.]|mgnify:CR=1 FL=1|uniref:L-rhamnose mutarotase n=1 Tax=uncultured Draconibacterium sp. TaxID=1573823 RepID=UPI0025EEDC66|nr:L-rhamnose mutarotase [uncultured Draconibacterium sp.]